MSRPLEQIRVLDLTNVLAGPFAAYQMALLGADVIKVEMRGTGDLARQLGADTELNEERLGASFLAQNSGKRSVTVDLKNPAGKEAFTALIRESDVLLENFRPGVMARLGFGWDELHALNPRLVYCAISGFGQSGPLRDRPAYDQIIQGLSGMMAVTGSQDSGPLRAGYPVADTLGGMAAAFGTCAALVRRQSTGEGSQVDVSMLETAVTAMGWVTSNYLVAGQTPVAMGNENFTAAPSGTFRTGDGDLNVSANKQEQFETLARLVGREDLLQDERFARREARKAHRAELRDELEKAFAAKPAADWEAELAAVGVPAGRVLGVADVLDHPQIRDRQLVHHLPFPGHPERDLRVLGNGIRVDETASTPALPPPRLGEHTDSVLSEIGVEPATIERWRNEGGI
ncbi:CaiB/BaiF CoA transferase family protein [Kineosporia babensis]|uniref:CoA transferase n=1 Tax=Kineosporia babensis TaxID=499548 RepID=A0A9X1NJ14_9ACTN|nr:CoA transferase [Kineosporia babensis]MCD5313998.1 CoA transferase [Kineosporia babensis]